MLRLLHRFLTHNRITSRLQRALVHRVKKLVYLPDGYYSMGQIYRKINPAAILDIGAHHANTVTYTATVMPKLSRFSSLMQLSVVNTTNTKAAR